MLYARFQHLAHKRVRGQGRRHQEAHSCVRRRRSGSQRGQVLLPVPPGAEEVGRDDDNLRAVGHARRKRVSQGRLRQLHVRCVHYRAARVALERLH